MIPLRDENPGRNTPWATWGLGLACVVVFVAEVAGVDPMPWALVPRTAWTLGALPTWPTHMFLHAGLLHLAGNLVYLLIFGNNVEDRMGPLRFLGFYVACGLLAGLAQVRLESTSEVPMVGASGAVAGVLGAYLALFPKVPVRAMIGGWIPVTVPAWVMLLAWFVWQVISVPFARIGSEDGVDGAIAYAAHVGGFVAGIVLHRAFLLPGERSRGNDGALP